MKGWLLFFILVMNLNLTAAEHLAPAFKLKDLHGKAVEFQPGHEEVIVVLNFWASWCSSCEGEIPELLALQKAYPEATFYGINQGENAKKAQRFMNRAKYPYQILLDEKEVVGKKFGIDSLPQTIVINEAGNEVFRGSRPPHQL